MRFMKDRRGATAIMFALSAIPLIGLAGLGTEAGTWYAVKRHAQNAADASALAGAMALLSGGNIDTRARNLATADGFTNTASPFAGATQSVSVSPTLTSVTTTVSQTQPMLLAPVLCIGRSDCSLSSVTISATATASIFPAQSVCMLALSTEQGNGGHAPLDLGGNQTIFGNDCSVMSNGNVKLASVPTLSGGSLFAAKGCTPTNTCSNTGAPSNWHAPPPKNPLARLDTLTLPSLTGTQNVYCPNQPSGPPANRDLCLSTIVTVTDASHWSLSPGTYDTVTVSSGTLKLTAGTYYIKTLNVSGGILTLNTGKYYIGSLNITGGTVNDTATVANVGGIVTVTGGENIVIETSLSVANSGATIHLTAHTDDTSLLNGVLFYYAHGTDASLNSVTFTGNGSSTYWGALYFPHAHLKWGGNSAAGGCTEIIAYELEFTGTSNIDTSACPKNKNRNRPDGSNSPTH